MQKKLSQIISVFNHKIIGQNTNPMITDICFDSRKAAPGSLFFALPGTHTHGNIFIPQAVENGASAVVYQDELPASVQQKLQLRKKNRQPLPVMIHTADTRFAMSPAAAVFYDYPSTKLAVIGVTGTEGKSSTVSFIWQLLRLAGEKTGFISTVEYSLGDDALPNPEHQTTPEAPIVQQRLNEMVQNGCRYAVVEASSHGLSIKTNRLGDVLFDAAVWMNVTHEHLEFHGTQEQYKYDKANLFRNLARHNHIKTITGTITAVPAFGVINTEDPAASYFAAATGLPVYGFTTYGIAGKSAKNLPPIPRSVPYCAAENIKTTADTISFTVSGHAGMPEVSTVPVSVNAPVGGAFNAYNLLAAIITTSNITGRTIAGTAPLCSKLHPIKGRMTEIRKGQPFEVIVDYAHTPSSFETIFPPIKQRATGHIIAVFGSAGERDTQKRSEQGRIAAQWCDTIILTDEDPRGEDSNALLEMIAAGCRETGKTEANGLYLIPDRPQAIRKAFSLADKNDIVLLLGKAHENSIIYKDYVMPYDEISEAEKALAEINFTGAGE